MIPINELRINNYVYYNNEHNEIGIITKLVTELITDINYVGINNRIDIHYLSKHINPIPLTEDWLLKLGFNKYFDKGKFKIIPKARLGYEKGRTYFNSWTILEKQPEYVHELQNLYFALTGEELIIK
jgi:hypothetical protein